MLRRHHQRRRIAVAGAAPCDRLTPLPESSSRSPAPLWLLSAARTLAAGAGKIFNVFRPGDSSDYSDSCLQSTPDVSLYGGSDADDSAAVDVDDGAMFTCTDEKENTLLGNSKACTTSKPFSLGTKECILKECSLVKDSLGTKELIEQLIQQETFLREECARLIKIIESRVIDFPAAKDFCKAGAFDETCASESGNALPPSAIQSHTPDIAVLEVKKGIQGKSVEKGDLSEGDTLVDVAKSFMLSRPPRASPSLFNPGYGSPPSSGLRYSSDKAPLASANQNITYSKLLKRHAFDTGSESVADGFRQVHPKLVEVTAEAQALSQSDNVSIVQEEGTRIISDDDMRVVIEGNSSVAARQEGIVGEMSSSKLDENGVIGNENGVALGQNMLEPILIEEYVSNLVRASDKNEGILEAKTDKDDREVESLQHSCFQDVMEHHNGEGSADKSHDLAVMPIKDVEASLPRLAAESVPLPAELVNDISHAVSSSHSHSVSAVSNTKGSRDVLSEAPAPLVRETVAPNGQSKKRKAAKVSIQSRRYVTRRTTMTRSGRVWK